MVKWTALLAVLLLATANAGEKAGLPRSLVTNMMDARERREPPAKAMKLAVDSGADRIDWPFNVWRIERMLEQGLHKDDQGRMVRKTDEDRRRSSLDRSATALAYVNKVICEWAVMELDAKYPRCDGDTIRALAGYRVDMDHDFWKNFAIFTKKEMLGGGGGDVRGWVTGWKLNEKIYLVLTSDLKSAGCPRDYQFVMWDGRKDWPIAGFEEFPDAARARAAMRVLESPASANNLAALMFAREANRESYMPDYVESLLRRAATEGCEVAFYNLGVLMEANGDKEQAAAFFSRGKAE